MAQQIDGYRQYETATCTAATHDLDLDEIRDNHRVYLTSLGMKSDRADADVEVFIVSGGQEFLIRHKENLSADEGHTQLHRCWIYTGEKIRFKFGGLTSGDKVEGWAVGEDKWEKESS